MSDGIPSGPSQKVTGRDRDRSLGGSYVGDCRARGPWREVGWELVEEAEGVEEGGEDMKKGTREDKEDEGYIVIES